MKDIDYILDFSVDLGRRMLLSGANLERVENTLTDICRSYRLQQVSLFALSNILILAARTKDGVRATRQRSVPASGIHLEQLKSLNELANRVCYETPDPTSLSALLNQASQVKTYPQWTIPVGFMIALCSICAIFGGAPSDLICTAVITAILYYVLRFIQRPGLNRIIVNPVAMFLAGSLTIFAQRIGLCQNYDIISITISMMLIPGVPMVNAVRNLLCGNEMNGILELFKVVLETITIAFGLCLSVYVFGGLVA